MNNFITKQDLADLPTFLWLAAVVGLIWSIFAGALIGHLVGHMFFTAEWPLGLLLLALSLMAFTFGAASGFKLKKPATLSFNVLALGFMVTSFVSTLLF